MIVLPTLVGGTWTLSQAGLLETNHADHNLPKLERWANPDCSTAVLASYYLTRRGKLLGRRLFLYTLVVWTLESTHCTQQMEKLGSRRYI